MRPCRTLLGTTLAAALALGTAACVDTNVAYPARFPSFRVDEVASEVDMSAAGPNYEASQVRTAVKEALDKWQPARSSSAAPARPARFRMVVDDKTDAITYVMLTVLAPVTLIFSAVGTPSGSATCSVDLTFDNGVVNRTSHQAISYPLGIWYTGQFDLCLERAAKLAIVDAAMAPALAPGPQP